MLDIDLFRNDKQREEIKKSERNRFKDEKIVDKIYELDCERIKVRFQWENLNKEFNIHQKSIKEAIKNKKKDENVKDILAKFEDFGLKDKQAIFKEKTDFLDKEILKLQMTIGNILDPAVPIHKTDDGNVTVDSYEMKRELKSNNFGFAELMQNYINAPAGAEVFGHRGYYLEGKLGLLANALKNYAIDFLTEKGYTFIQTPVMLRREVMAATAQLSDFDEQLYKVEDDLYLIATSEQPMTALFMNKRLTDSDLPKSFAGESLCFRKEAGAYGKDNAGIFRVHQFEKIEQFVLCKPEESNDFHEKMIEVSKEFYKSLDISYNVVLISSGEMNDAASKKYDLEALFPNAGKYRELVSASNCTDYQSRNLNVYYGFTKNGEKPQFVHMLNSTLCAVQRTLCCIVENYQDGEKILVPEVLKKYLNFEIIE